MTPMQFRALEFIDRYKASHGVAPTFAQIGEALGLRGRANAFMVVRRLEQEGYVRRGPARAYRTLEVLKRPPALAMPGSAPGLPRLTRSLEQWRNMVPTAVADGSRAQVVFALGDAKADIAALAACVLELLAEREAAREPAV